MSTARQDMRFISIVLTIIIILGTVIFIKGSWAGFILYLVILALIAGFAG